MKRRTRDDWLAEGGMPVFRASKHRDAWARRHAHEYLTPDSSGMALWRFCITRGVSLKAVADGLGIPYKNLHRRVHYEGFSLPPRRHDFRPQTR